MSAVWIVWPIFLLIMQAFLGYILTSKLVGKIFALAFFILRNLKGSQFLTMTSSFKVQNPKDLVSKLLEFDMEDLEVNIDAPDALPGLDSMEGGGLELPEDLEVSSLELPGIDNMKKRLGSAFDKATGIAKKCSVFPRFHGQGLIACNDDGRSWSKDQLCPSKSAAGV
jgi:hypothetical protein